MTELLIGQQQKPPACPHCASSPLKYVCNIQNVANGAVVFMCWCADCGKLLPIQFIAMQQPQIMPASRLS